MMPVVVSQRNGEQIHYFVCDQCDRTWQEIGEYIRYTSDCNPGEHVSDELYVPPTAGYCYGCCDRHRPKEFLRREVTEAECKAFQEAALVRKAKADLHDS